MARLESDLAENVSTESSPKKSEDEKKLSKKEKKKKRLAKDSAENGDEGQSSNKSDSNDGQGYLIEFFGFDNSWSIIGASKCTTFVLILTFSSNLGSSQNTTDDAIVDSKSEEELLQEQLNKIGGNDAFNAFEEVFTNVSSSGMNSI